MTQNTRTGAKADLVAEVVCKVGMGSKTRPVAKTSFYKVYDAAGNPAGTAAVTKELPKSTNRR